MNYRLHIPLTDKDFRRLVGTAVMVGYCFTTSHLMSGPINWQNVPVQMLGMPEWGILYDRYSVLGELDGINPLYDLVLKAARSIWILSIDERN